MSADKQTRKPTPDPKSPETTTSDLASTPAPEPEVPAPAPQEPAQPDRPSLAELSKAAHEGRQFEISKAVSWAPDYVGVGFYVDGSWRRYWVGTAHNEQVLDVLANDDRYLVRLV